MQVFPRSARPQGRGSSGRPPHDQGWNAAFVELDAGDERRLAAGVWTIEPLMVAGVVNIVLPAWIFAHGRGSSGMLLRRAIDSDQWL